MIIDKRIHNLKNNVSKIIHFLVCTLGKRKQGHLLKHIAIIINFKKNICRFTGSYKIEKCHVHGTSSSFPTMVTSCVTVVQY